MKNLLLMAVLLMNISCGKSAAPADSSADAASPAPYDTTAVDSFSAGASPRSSILPDSLPKKISDSIKLIKKDKEKP